MCTVINISQFFFSNSNLHYCCLQTPAVSSEGHSSQVAEPHGGLSSTVIVSRADLPDELAVRDDGTIVASNDVSTVPEPGMSVSEAYTSGSHDVVQSGDTVIVANSHLDEVAASSGDMSGPIEGLLDNYVVVRYDGKPYPGKVIDIDRIRGDVKVSCMHSVGRNLFFWPHRADVCWYEICDILTVITEPQKVTGTGRHMQIDPKVYAAVSC